MSYAVFPSLPSMAWDSKKTMSWDTKIQKYGSGRRKALSKIAWPEWEIECTYKALDPDAVAKAAGFFGMVRGQLTPFLWLDPEDYKAENVQIGAGTGASASYQLLRSFGGYYVEPILDVVPGTLKLYADGAEISNFTLGNDGVVTLTATVGAIITHSCQYYWRVAFADDDLEQQNFWFNYYKLNSVKLVTVK